MTLLVNRAKMTTATTGTGVITLGSAVSGYQSFGAAGVTNGSTVSYVIEDNGNWEIGGGVYTATGTTLSRTPVQSSNAGAAITLSGSAVVYVAAIASDIVPSSGGTFSGGVTVNGTMNATTLAIGGTSITSTAAELNFVSDVTSLIQAQLDGKAPLASPALTGTPTAPTAIVGTNTTQLATTAFVNAEIANDAPTKTGTGASGTWGISVTGSSGSTTGNAATATTLQTARAINGVSFNGSADITVADSTKLPLSGGTVTGDITMSGTGMIKVPLGTTAQRPVTPATGMIRFNSTRSCFEGYNGTGWVNLSPVLFDDIGAIA